MAEKSKSEQPTVLIAPSDYEHIFKGLDDDELSFGKVVEKRNRQPKQSKAKEVLGESLKTIASEQPTMLIAPSDYEHIFKGPISEFTDTKNQRKEKFPRIISDTPTALIAPSDFEHIYADPFLSKGKDQSRGEGRKKIDLQSFRNVEERSASKQSSPSLKFSRKPKRKLQQQQYHNRLNPKQSQEKLPQSILDLVNRFLKKAPQSYTIYRLRKKQVDRN
ncbi:uncharacterized protein NH340_JMT02651 [Sarcoptes scabiei]|nr:uncharacterized protein NH340_JMT02651 [Sarcoptes scabiei]